jgi:hypothetical protein
MTPASTGDPHNHRVIVIASSIEGIDALARLVHQLPSTFPLPVVVQVHGLRRRSIDRLTGSRWQMASRLNVVYAQDGDHVGPGFVYVIPAENGLVFTARDVLGYAIDVVRSSVDDLFKSAARWYGSGVIGVVLSGLGTDGTIGFQAITKAEGIRIVQSPTEAVFSGMPTSALNGDHVQYSVMLDQLVVLLKALMVQPDPAQTLSTEVGAELTQLLSTSKEDRAKSLDRSITDLLELMRLELAMDIVFVSKEAGDAGIVSQSTSNPNEAGSQQGTSLSRTQSLDQRVLHGRLPTVMPDVAAFPLTHDVPVISITPDAYMTAPVWLRSGTLYGTLCCLDLAVSPELGQRRYERLQMSARQIARLVNEAGEN